MISPRLSQITERLTTTALASSLRPVIANTRHNAAHSSLGFSTSGSKSQPKHQAQASVQSQAQTTNPQPRRRLVTAFNDDGVVPWSKLSLREKTSRATQQSFNFAVVAAGVVLTAAVIYVLFDEVFAPESKVAQFSRAVSLIKKDPRCIAILGDPEDIWAHGEPTANKWQRSRPISSTLEKDSRDVEHLIMQFYVEGPKAMGVVHLHMSRRPKADDFEYKYLFLDAKGHDRIYIKRDETKGRSKKPFSFLGISWG
ncbi:Mitochondrial import inner membrane translocase subunit tim21 [Ceratocystis lukuohia]|uniref:Mitochondrial import inner membrane translocase subunit Tim21 n=1 Tax=Ceratocystis lukuohia TaxID=2019550 RepID=A0ABR4MQ03_9PEZI